MLLSVSVFRGKGNVSKQSVGCNAFLSLMWTHWLSSIFHEMSIAKEQIFCIYDAMMTHVRLNIQFLLAPIHSSYILITLGITSTLSLLDIALYKEGRLYHISTIFLVGSP